VVNEEVALRICSLLCSGTEIVYELGLGDDLVAVTDRCDYPTEAKGKPVASRDVISSDLPSDEIDHIVREAIRAGRSTHILDEEVLRAARPDLVLTQDLCDVCDVGSNEVAQVFRDFVPRPRFLVLGPRTLGGVLRSMIEVGEAAGAHSAARQTVAKLEARLRAVGSRTMLASHRPRVACLEWLDPLIAPGHWAPEMIWLAGGALTAGLHGAHGVRVEWPEIAASAPEVLILHPCGFSIERTLEEIDTVANAPEWASLPAVQSGEVYVMDPNYLSRPGPRLVRAVEILGRILQPELVDGDIPEGVVRKLDPASSTQVPWRDRFSEFASVGAPTLRSGARASTVKGAER